MVRRFGWGSVALRFALALAVVGVSWNPSGTSFWHWATAAPMEFTPAKGIVAVILLIGWVVLLRATLRSLGGAGMLLAGALFACLFWGLLYWGLLPADNVAVLQWLGVLLIVFILTAGVCWSHIRRRLSGQYDMDDVDQP